ncbi:MAG: DUF4340 domain-containing protein [Lachnospiraceae bacterium]|nr:DUF4340 domain-containing protein [Lachnospiraceae bacterium]
MTYSGRKTSGRGCDARGHWNVWKGRENVRAKKKRSLIILCAVIIMLVPVYFLVRNRSSAFEKKLTGAKSLTSITADRIKGIRYKGFGEEEWAASFVREEGTWHACGPDWEAADTGDALSGSDTGGIDQAAVSNLAASLTGVRLYQVIIDVEDPGQYGLEEPEHTVEILDTSGRVTKIYTGNENTAAGKLYCMLDGDRSTVYAVSTALTGNLDRTAEEYMAEVDEG